MVEAYGETLDDRFANAAYALFDQMTDATRIDPTGEIRLELEADGREQLLVDFLQELLFLHDVENLVFGQFEVKVTDNKLVALARGEPFDEEKHTKRSVVKGVTYHRLEFDDPRKTVTVLFDV